MSFLVSAHQLSKSLGPRTLFKGLSFGLTQGDRLGLVGPNGAGKSTLLKMLAKIEEPDSGEIFWARGTKLGYLAQFPEFEPTITVEDSLLSACANPNEDESHAKAEELISKIGLHSGTFDRKKMVSKLSGGQQKKVALARELMKNPDVLLLDEPTNHLDIESLLWLEEFINDQYNLTLLVVTHDRLFLQNTTDMIMDLDPRYKEGFLKIDGSYADYLEARSLRLEGQLSQEANRANDLRREMAWLQRGARARTTKAKSRIQSTYDLDKEVKALRTLNKRTRIDLKLSTGGFVPKKLIEAKGITKTYGDRTLFRNLDILISAGSRIALLGKNGTGKTTLIRALLGEESVTSGTITRPDTFSVSYLEQTRDTLDPEKTLIQNLCGDTEYVMVHGQNVFAKGYLERFKFNKDQHHLLLKRLSGGEQARLLVAKLMLTEAAILVLDEPTNDLDMETLEVLREALVDYSGAVLLVTHDRFFMEQVSDSILAFPEPEDLLEHEAPGTLVRFESFLQWQTWREERRKPKKTSQPSVKKSVEPKKVKLSFNEKYELENMEKVIAAQESGLKKMQTEILLPENASNTSRLIELSKAIDVAEKEIEALYQRWAELEKKIQA